MNHDYSNKSFIDGSTLWQDDIRAGLHKVQLQNGNWELYENTPCSLYDSLVNSKNHFPDKCCIVDDNGATYTYQQFFELVEEFSRVLYTQYYVRAGSRIGLLMYNSIEFCTAFYAINKLRAIIVPLSTKYRKAEIFSLMEKVELSGIIYDKDFSEWFRGTLPSSAIFLLPVTNGQGHCTLPVGGVVCDLQTDCRSLDDTAILMFTSGTTSQSKGVCLSNYNAIHAITVYQKIFHITEADRTVIPVPIYHVTGLLALLGLFIHCGSCIYLHKFFNARRVLNAVNQYNITFLHGSPTVFSMLMEHEGEWPNLPSLRILACGSANMPKAKILKLHQWIPHVQFRTVYGLTETSSPATIFPNDAAVSPYIGSSGQPVPGVQFKICNEEGTLLPYNTPGSVVIKGSVVTTGYYHLQAKAFQNGWLDTGDIGYLNKEGYLYIVDRKKDMINRGGEKICSLDVENVLYSIPGIAEATVVGIPDAIYGETPAAMIKLSRGISLTAEEIQLRLKKSLATFQIPTKFIFTDRLPITPNGKIDKNKIRQLLSQNL